MTSEYSAEIIQSSANILQATNEFSKTYKTLDHYLRKTEDSFQDLNWFLYFSRSIVQIKTIKLFI